MAIKVIEKKVLSSDGIHQLNGKVWLPEGEPKGLFHVVHGMTEYIARYDFFMHRMAEEGYIVFGYDHLGHGHTARSKEELGFIAHTDGWRYLVKDVAVFGYAMKREYGEKLPYVLMGHSMGSFVVRLAAAEYDIDDSLIVMGTGNSSPVSGFGLWLTDFIRNWKGDRHLSTAVELFAFGTYNTHFMKEKDLRSWLTKDVDFRNRYADDELCNFRFTVSAMNDLVMLSRECNKKSCVRSLNRRKPVLLVSGSEDPVGNYGKGVYRVYRMMRSAGIPAKLKLYKDYRHEILNDACRDKVIEDICEFLK